MSYSSSNVEQECLILFKNNRAFIADKIKKQRKRMKLTQFELAEKVGLHEKQISRIENGSNYPTLDNFFKILEALNLKLEDFSSETSEHSEIKEELLSLINSSDEKLLQICLDLFKVIINNK